MGYRERYLSVGKIRSGGTQNLWWDGSPFPGGQPPQEFEAHILRMNDYTDRYPYPDHPLWSLQARCSSGLDISGTTDFQTGTGIRTVYNNYNPEWAVNAALIQGLEDDLSGSDAYDLTQSLANLNPNVASVDLPAFLFELKDFPEMLHQLGRVLAKRVKASDVAGGYLAYSFGWAPLFSDLKQLLTLSDIVDARLKRLEEFGKGSVSRTLGKNKSNSAPYTIELVGKVAEGRGPLTAVVTTSTSVKSWYSAKVRLTEPLPDRQKLRSDEFRRALGLTANSAAATLWEILPWSWLIDYFVNVSNMIAANTGGIKYNTDRICTMREIRTTRTISPNSGDSGLTAKESVATKVTRTRSAYTNPTPIYAFRPIWTDHMQAIVGSLVTARALKKLER